MSMNTVNGAAERTPQSLLESLGGEEAVDALVGALYFNILNDGRVARFFASVDVDVIRNHQRRFLTFALGGEDHYRGRGMREAHRRLVEEQGLDDSHFDAIVHILAATLADFDYPADLIREVIATVGTLRDEVLG